MFFNNQTTQDKLQQWLKSILNKKVDYCGVLTRRCLNLLEVLLNRFKDELTPGLLSQCDQIMTENGFLLKAEEIASSYLKEEKFPTILLADDLLVHGRSINRFYQVFQELVYDCERKKTDMIDYAKFKEDFYNNFTLFVFSENDTAILLQPELQKCVKYYICLPEIKWRDFSIGVAKAIYTSDFANTSYVISAKLKYLNGKKDAVTCLDANKNEETWIRFLPDDLKKDENTAIDFYIHSLTFHYQKVFPTVRVYKKSNGFLFIPYFFFQFTVDEAKHIVAVLKNSSSDPAAQHLFDLMVYASRVEKLYPLLSQMIYLVLSQITLSYFFADTGLNRYQKYISYDTKKLARNFGNIDQMGFSIESALDAVCKIEWEPSLLSNICGFLRFSGNSLTLKYGGEREFKLANVDFLQIIENEIYQQAIEHERRAYKARSLYLSGGQLPADVLDVTGERPFHAFLSDVLSQAGSFKENIEVIATVLYYVAHEMDVGDISLKTRVTYVDGEYICYSTVRNTELSLSILPRRLGRFYRDMVNITRAFWNERDFLEWVFLSFNVVLPNRDKNDEAKKYIGAALDFARILQDNKLIIDTLLNWNGDSFKPIES